jgi:hypothetical protein
MQCSHLSDFVWKVLPYPFIAILIRLCNSLLLPFAGVMLLLAIYILDRIGHFGEL